MKKIFLTFITSVALSASLWAQAPQSFNYQGVARDLSGTALATKNISVKASILDGSATGTVVYSETHSISTNQFGLFSLAIGSGTVVSGVFANTNWGTGSKFLKIEIDPNGGSSYTLAGTTQLLSVPYAMYAGKSGDSKWSDATGGINYSGGKVGIGTSAPLYYLDCNYDNTNPSVQQHGVRIMNLNTSTSGSYTNFKLFSNDNSTGHTDLVHFANNYKESTQAGNSYLTAYEGSLNLQTVGKNRKIMFNTAVDGQFSSIVNRMVLDLNGNLGIGIANPTAQLHTNGTVRFQGLTANNTLTTALVTDANGNVYTKDISSFGGSQWTDATGGINYAGGKVGIGTSAPDWFFTIKKNASGADRNFIMLNNTNNGNDATGGLTIQVGTDPSEVMSLGYGGPNYSLFPNSASRGIVQSKNLALKATSATGDIGFHVGGTDNEKMILTSSGKVGIGTSTPSAKLHVSSGDVYIDDATKGIIMKNTSGQCYRVTVGAAGALVSTLITCP